MTGAAFDVAGPVEGREHLLAEFGGLPQDRGANIRRGVGKARQVVVAPDLENVVQKEQDILDRGLVDGHGSPPSARHRLTSESNHLSPPIPDRPAVVKRPHRTAIATAAATDSRS